MLPTLKLNFSEKHKMCKFCLFRLIEPSTHYKEDELISEANKLVIKTVADRECEICRGITLSTLNLTEKLHQRLAKVEYNSYIVGCSVHKKNMFIDKKFEDRGFSYQSVKIFVVNYFREFLKQEGQKELKQDLPELTILIEVKTKPRFKLDIRSLYVLGKYNKLIRGIPQTKWPCSICKGKKCEICNYTGQQYPRSVESIIAHPFLEASKSLYSSFHGAGREDIDALMLGDGRPFVLELKQPLVRSIDILNLQRQVNKSEYVKINRVQFTEKTTISLLKNSSPNSKKKYKAEIQLSANLDEDIINKLNQMGKQQLILKQQTPLRVSHRRSDKVREKIIYSFVFSGFEIQSQSIIVMIHAQGGTYIKEFISGDEGRTKPNLSDLVGQQLVCIALDVLQVDDNSVFTPS